MKKNFFRSNLLFYIFSWGSNIFDFKLCVYIDLFIWGSMCDNRDPITFIRIRTRVHVHSHTDTQRHVYTYKRIDIKIHVSVTKVLVSILT